MRIVLLALSLIALPSSAAAQPAPQPRQPTASAVANLPRHLVMITRAGPNFSKVREHRPEVEAHHALWRRLQTEGYTFAGGAFEGEPIMGMTIFNGGIDEARVRELIKDDPFPKLGIAHYEFRTFIVVNGSFKLERD